MDIKKTLEDIGQVVIDESRQNKNIGEIAEAVAEKSVQELPKTVDKTLVAVILSSIPTLFRLLLRLFK